MREVLIAGLVGVSLLTGCATAPPSPPFAESVVGGSEEYRWAPFRWTDGTRLSYKIETFEETAFGGRVDSKRSKQSMQMWTIGRAASGSTRVRVSIDNTSIADALFDDGGHLKDVSVLIKAPESVVKMMTGMIVRTWQHPLAKQFEKQTFKINERFTTEVALSDFLAPMLMPITEPEPKAGLSVTYTGQKRMNHAIALELYSVLTVPPSSKYKLDVPGVTIQMHADSINLETREWLDPSRGYWIQKYEVVTSVL
jgi:hypothetical protein